MRVRWAVGLVVGLAPLVLAFVGVLGASGCASGQPTASTARWEPAVDDALVRAAEAGPADAATGEKLGPLGPIREGGGGESFVRLAVDGFRPAVVSVPLGSRPSEPLLVATHGAGGRPDSQCHLWRRIVGQRGFVLCPAGIPTHPGAPEPETGYYYAGHPALGDEIAAAIEALGQRFGARLDRREPLYAGYSQGATMGAMVLPTHSAAFARAVLVEGGVGEAREWNIAVAARFAARGGRRVLLACGRPACARVAAKTVGHLRRGGLEAEMVHAIGAGHSCHGLMAEAIERRFAWLVEGDERWGVDGATGAAERRLVLGAGATSPNN